METLRLAAKAVAEMQDQAKRGEHSHNENPEELQSKCMSCGDKSNLIRKVWGKFGFRGE
jgi:ribosomal protein S14